MVRGKQVWTMAYCHGDAMIDNLRIARARLERSLKTLRKCTATGRENEERHDIGRYLEGVVDDLEDGGTNRMEWGWFLRRAGTVMDTVLDAEGMDDDEWPAPEEETWKDFRALSAALREHGEAIKQLHAAESLAAPSPVNVKEHAPSPAGAGVDSSGKPEPSPTPENKAAGDGCCVSTCCASSFVGEDALDRTSIYFDKDGRIIREGK